MRQVGRLVLLAGVVMAVAVVLATGGPAFSGGGIAEEGDEPTATIEVAGPFVSDNLAVYLLLGEDTIALDDAVTLDEAMAKGWAVVRETGNVNELVVENIGAVDVFVEAGDIVKGGRQDRVLSTDLLLAPRSGPVNIEAFCVESGRWSQRGEESLARFEASDQVIPSAKLKRAVNKTREQGAVWEEVKAFQRELEAVAVPAAAAESPTSLQLTLEGETLEQRLRPYLEGLGEVGDGRDKVVGFAFAVNGKLLSADIYGAARLASKRWPKLLRAAASEALLQKTAPASEPPPGQEVAAMLRDLEGIAATERMRSEHGSASEGESEEFHVIENRSKDSHVVHKVMLRKD